MKHEYYELLISRDKDNDLSIEEKEILNSHLLKCKKCAEFKLALNRLDDMFSVKSEYSIKRKKPTIKKLYPYFASVAAALILAFGLVFLADSRKNVDVLTSAYTNEASIYDSQVSYADEAFDTYYKYSTFSEDDFDDNYSTSDNYNALSNYYSYIY